MCLSTLALQHVEVWGKPFWVMTLPVHRHHPICYSYLLSGERIYTIIPELGDLAPPRARPPRSALLYFLALFLTRPNALIFMTVQPPGLRVVLASTSWRPLYYRCGPALGCIYSTALSLNSVLFFHVYNVHSRSPEPSTPYLD